MRVHPMSIAALVCAVILPPFGILMGHIAWSQCRRERRPGAGLALAAMIVGYTELLVFCGVPILNAGF
jgi:peptidyl-prolyl cis-trans isomerase B (cyclophilin B)